GAEGAHRCARNGQVQRLGRRGSGFPARRRRLLAQLVAAHADPALHQAQSGLARGGGRVLAVEVGTRRASSYWPVPTMGVFYLDPALHDDVGHHANYCRYIVGELRGRGVETLVFGHEDLPARLQAELGSAAHFRVYTYTDNDDDPLCAWLTGFDTLTRTT